MISSWSLFGRQWRRNRGVVLTANPSEVANLSRLHATQIIQVTPANLKVIFNFPPFSHDEQMGGITLEFPL